MKKKLISIFSFCILLATTSCSDEHKAKTLATDFLDKNMKGDYSSVKVQKFDSTSHIGKQQIEQLHDIMSHDSDFNENIEYASYDNQEKLYYVRLSYQKKSDSSVKKKTIQTFYFDKSRKGIIAFKNQ